MPRIVGAAVGANEQPLDGALPPAQFAVGLQEPFVISHGVNDWGWPPGSKSWRPDLHTHRLSPGVAGVSSNGGRVDGSGLIAGLVRQRRTVITIDQVGKAGLKSYMATMPTAGGPIYIAAWEYVEVVGETYRLRCDLDAYNAYRDGLIKAGLIAPILAEVREQLIAMSKGRISRLQDKHSENLGNEKIASRLEQAVAVLEDQTGVTAEREERERREAIARADAELREMARARSEADARAKAEADIKAREQRLATLEAQTRADAVAAAEAKVKADRAIEEAKARVIALGDAEKAKAEADAKSLASQVDTKAKP